MKTLQFICVALITGNLLAACAESPRPITNDASTDEHAIDGLSRNITHNQGGAIRDPATLSPPPITPNGGYVQDR